MHNWLIWNSLEPGTTRHLLFHFGNCFTDSWQINSIERGTVQKWVTILNRTFYQSNSSMTMTSYKLRSLYHQILWFNCAGRLLVGFSRGKSIAYVDVPNTIEQLKDEKQYYITFTIYLFIYQIIYYK